MSVRLAIAGCLVLAGMAVPADAQTALDRPVGRIEIDGGAGLIGGATLNDSDANLRVNDQTSRTARLFATSSDISSAPLWFARVSYSLSRRFVLEGALTRSNPDVRTAVTSDAEGATPLTAAERIDQYFIDGSLLVMLDELQVGRRLVPFVVAGGGYLRQLHEGQALVDQGQVYNAGGGVKYWLTLRKAGTVRAVGLRGEAKAYLLRGGFSFDDEMRAHLAIAGSVFVGF
jgi:hypothetical protein